MAHEDQMEAESAESDSKELLSKRACDQCRLRKVRCDKRSPCSNCQSAQIICRSTGAGQKPKEERRRVLISSQYEKKIDLIEERLSNIEDVLSQLKSYIVSNKPSAESFHHTASSPKEQTPAGSGYTSNTTAALDQHDSGAAFEGNSSMAAHSVYASAFLETVVSQSAPQISTPKVNAALAALKQIVNMQSHPVGTSSRELRLPCQKDMRGSNLRDLAMPPMQVVVGILRKIKEHPPFGFQCYFPFLEVDDFIQKCRQVYFATENYSDATFIVANGGLYQIFIEYSFLTSSPQTRAEYQKYIELCRNNLETALGNLSLLMPVERESIEALLLGAVHAIEISKASFAWNLVSIAARLSQTLGWHRGSFMDQNENRETMKRDIRVFWTIYCLDKGLSLRLGHASTIQDYDTTLPDSSLLYAAEEPWGSFYQLWVKMSAIQGKVYEQLYSPAGLSQPEHERVFYARELASEMETSVIEPLNNLKMITPVTSEIEALWIRSDEVSRLAVMTLIYRAIPPAEGSTSTFIPECIEAARGALEIHQTCMISLTESNEATKGSYLHWTLLYAPFVPFIVLFCHVIEVSSRPDLARMEDFVSSLAPNCFVSEAIAKLHSLCQVLSNVARLYVEAKAQAQIPENQGLALVGQEFDTYLSALGMAPASGEGISRWNAAVTEPGIARSMSEIRGGIETASQTQLGSWFSGNQHMTGLLEEDMSLWDPATWPYS